MVVIERAHMTTQSIRTRQGEQRSKNDISALKPGISCSPAYQYDKRRVYLRKIVPSYSHPDRLDERSCTEQIFSRREPPSRCRLRSRRRPEVLRLGCVRRPAENEGSNVLPSPTIMRDDVRGVRGTYGQESGIAVERPRWLFSYHRGTDPASSERAIISFSP